MVRRKHYISLSSRHKRRLKAAKAKRLKNKLYRKLQYISKCRLKRTKCCPKANTNQKIEESVQCVKSNIILKQQDNIKPNPRYDEILKENKHWFPESMECEEMPTLVKNNYQNFSKSKVEKLNFPEESYNEDDLLERIAKWALLCKIKHVHTTMLLFILRHRFPQAKIPKHARTFLKTPRKCKIYDLPPGSYIHLGFEHALNYFLMNNLHVKEISIQIGIDGLPIHIRDGNSLWPIMGCIIPDGEVFLIGCYFGAKKPCDSYDYLRMFVTDINNLLRNGFSYNQNTIEVTLHSFILDKPAKAFILKVKYHTGRSSCVKCKVVGKSKNSRFCFPGTNFELRTDKEFSNQDDSEHHSGKSILVEIDGFSLKIVPEDPMHLFYVGIVKKILILWHRPKTSFSIMSSANGRIISNYLLSIKQYIPPEMARKTRDIEEHRRFKATESSLFLKYTGPIALTSFMNMNDDIYQHFLTLHIAVRLLSTEFDHNMVTYAESLLQDFVEKFASIYGEEFVSPNVHSLLHIADDAKLLGNINNFSAFKFENFLRHLKQLLRKPERPLAQILKRYGELAEFGIYFPHQMDRKKIGPSQEHHKGPRMAECFDPQYKKYTFSNYSLSTEVNSDCCGINDEIVIIENFMTTADKEICVIGRKFLSVENFYTEPLKSSKLNIYKVRNLSKRKCWLLKDVRLKFMRLAIPKDQNTFVVLPLQHTDVKWDYSKYSLEKLLA